MRLNINVKPIMYIGNSKMDIQRKLRGYGLTISNFGTYISSDDNKNAIVINYHKVNRKTKRTKTKTGYKSKVINTAHWVGYVYHFNLDLLKATNLKVIQKSRNFEIVKNKK